MHWQKLLAMGVAALGTVPHSTLAASASQSPCMTLATYQNNILNKKDFWLPTDVFNIEMNAEMAYNCTLTVPFSPKDATASMPFIKNYTSRLTTLAFLKDPPQSYQQPAVDVMARLDEVSDNIKNNKYTNEYEFELDLMSIARDSHEGHFRITPPLLTTFYWKLPDSIMSLSKDGKELPQTYASSDIFRHVNNPSPIVEIEGENVFKYLQNYMGRTDPIGLIEPHAEWNALMWSGAQYFSGFGVSPTLSQSFNRFQNTPIYNGLSLKGRFANGSDFTWAYTANSYRSLMKEKLTSGVDIYNAEVANMSNTTPFKANPGSFVDSETRATRTEDESDSNVRRQQPPVPTPSKVFDAFNYPTDPVVVEEHFGVGGIVSGYILKDDSVGVLSLPSFDGGSGDANNPATPLNYSNAVADFISEAKKSQVKKLVIDLSANGGGTTFLGYHLFKQFFPSIEPSLLGRVRATSTSNTMGSIIDGFLYDEGKLLGVEAYVNMSRDYGARIGASTYLMLDSDGKPFDSWKDFYGPRKNHGDSFTNGAKYNLSSPVITSQLGEAVPGYGGSNAASQDVWKADDIILLHDGICASTCAIFSEMMKNEAGVKSVAVGGIPENGPMQGVSGTRGSLLEKFSQFSLGIEDVRSRVKDLGKQAISVLGKWGVTLDDVAALPRPLTEAPLLIQGNVNALDMIRPSNLDDPMEFTYQASDCRLFYTFDMARDITVLWRAAAKVAGGDFSDCVPGSTDAAGKDKDDVVTSDPGYSYNKTWEKANTTEVPDNKKANTSDDDSAGAVVVSFSIGTMLLVALTIALAV